MKRSNAGLDPAEGSKVMVTGHRGMVGTVVVDALRHLGFEPVGCDRSEGDDITDPAAVGSLMNGCAAVVHLAAIDDIADPADALAPPSTGDIAAVMSTNVAGTANVLAAAEEVGVRRVVFMSSVDVLGCFLGKGPPRYFPIDDEHPVEPRSPYAWSKLAAEEMCEAFSDRSSIPSVCLRPPGVFTEEIYQLIGRARGDRPSVEWSPIWEYGAFLDVRDLAQAVIASLTTELEGHHRLLVCANDISSADQDSLSLAQQIHPGVPITDYDRFRTNPYAALLDTSRAQSTLGWTPSHSWRS